MYKNIMKSIKDKMKIFGVKVGEFIERYYLLRFTKGVINRIRDDRVTGLSAQITYYMLLAIFPFLIFLLNLLIFFDIDQEILMNTIIQLIPEQSSHLIFSIVNEVVSNSGVTLLSIGMITTLWSASKGVNALIAGLNKAYDVKEKRSFFVVKAIALVATIGIPAIMISSFLFLVLGEQIGQFVSNEFGLTDYLGLWRLLRVLSPLVGMVVYFTLLYKLAPNRHIKIKHALIGSIFSTVCWIGASMLFSYYVNNFGNYSKVYGGLGSIIILLLWLNLSIIILIVGGEINAEIAKPFVQRQES
ncbi:MAG: YihY/virulence factor BrkB family protein [Acidaminobacteraceae bacterium]